MNPTTASSRSAAVPRFSPARVPPNAWHAFGGLWRMSLRRYFTAAHWLTLAGMAVALAVFSLPMAPTREAAAQNFLPWASDFYVCFLVPLLAFVAAAGVMRDDLKAASVDYIFTRPVRRPAFVLFRYVSHLACAQFDFLLALLVVIAVGVYRDVPGLGAAIPLLLLAQAVAITVFSAFGFLAGMLTSRYVIVGLLYGGIVEVGIGNVPTQLNRISMVRHVQAILEPLGAGTLDATAPRVAVSLSAPAAIAVLLVIAVVLLAATAALFTWRELAADEGRDT